VSGSLMDQLRTTLCGSPCWMAPEVMLRAWPQGRQTSSGYDSAVDIWSLGITALELAKGRPPFSDYAPSRVFSMVVQNPPPALEDGTTSKKKFSSSFKDFVRQCLQKDPSKRSSATKLLKHKFFKNKKSRDYLVSTVLGKLPPLGERSSIMDVSQVLPYRPLTRNSEKMYWDFLEGQDSEENLVYNNSYESCTPLSSSDASPAGLEETGLADDSPRSDSSFFDEWFAAPTPANTMNSADFMKEVFNDLSCSSSDSSDEEGD